MAGAEYVRQLEDALLTVWAELPTEQVRELRAVMPRLMDFVGHLHHRVEHEQWMVRQNVWADDPDGREFVEPFGPGPRVDLATIESGVYELPEPLPPTQGGAE